MRRDTNSVAIEGLAAALVPVLLPLLIKALATRHDERDSYTSEDLPPRTSRRRFAEVCRSGRVHGARREGNEWVCARDDWHSARAKRAPQRKASEQAFPADLTAIADEALARAGLRVVPKDRK